MKSIHSNLLLIVVIFLLSSCSGRWVREHVTFQYVDPLEKVFPETNIFREREASLHVARGEHASLQFVYRSTEPTRGLSVKVHSPVMEDKTLGKPKAGFVGYVPVGRATPMPTSRDRIHSISGFYPDPIIPAEKKDIDPSVSQPIWVTIPIPTDAEPGTYTGKVTIRGRSGGKRVKRSELFTVRVYEPVVEKTSLWVTNWFSLQRFHHMNKGEPVEEYSDLYWEYTRKLARKMAEYCQNVARISPLRMAEYTINDSLRYEIDFTRFNRAVKIFQEEGVLGRIEGGHIGARDSNWTSPFVVFVPVQKPDTLEMGKFSIKNDTARIFYEQFFHQLTENLEKNGWKDIYMQHLADEPIEPNMDSYIEIARFVKDRIPEIPIVEACHTRNLDSTVNVWVPQLNFFHTDYDFYKERMEKGDEVWFYTCLAPKGDYANRFLDLPLLKTRILHWINFKYNSPGYLHWGFNQWRGKDVYKETTFINKESGNVLPAGDAWIVYPGDGEIYSSIRLEAMRDGIVDYELLKMLAEKDEEIARELARRVVFRFTVYEMDIDGFRSIRRKILELLSGSGEVQLD